MQHSFGINNKRGRNSCVGGVISFTEQAESFGHFGHPFDGNFCRDETGQVVDKYDRREPSTDMAQFREPIRGGGSTSVSKIFEEGGGPCV